MKEVSPKLKRQTSFEPQHGVIRMGSGRLSTGQAASAAFAAPQIPESEEPDELVDYSQVSHHATKTSFTDEQFSPFGRDIDIEYVKHPMIFNDFIKEKSSVAIPIDFSREHSLIFRWDSLGDLYYYHPGKRTLYSLDLNYNAVEVFKNVDLDGFQIIENFPAEFYQTVTIPDSYHPVEERKSIVLGWNKERLFLIGKQSFQTFETNVGANISQVIGRYIEPKDQWEALASLTNGNVIFLCFEETLRIKHKHFSAPDDELLYVSPINTHMMLVFMNSIKFIGFAEEIEPIKLNNPILKNADDQLDFVNYIRSDYCLMFNYLGKRSTKGRRTNKVVRYSLETGYRFYFRDYQLLPSHHLSGKYYIMSGSCEIFCCNPGESFTRSCGIYTVDPPTITPRHIISFKSDSLIIKELRTSSTKSLGSVSVFVGSNLDTNEWKDKILPHMLTKTEQDVIQRLRNVKGSERQVQVNGAEELQESTSPEGLGEIANVYVLDDCLARVSRSEVTLYPKDSDTAFCFLGRSIIDDFDRCYLSKGHSHLPLHHNIEVVDGSWHHQIFLFKRSKILLMVQPKNDRLRICQMLTDCDGIRAFNSEFTSLLVGTKLFTMRGGELKFHNYLEPGWEAGAQVFPSVDRQHLIVIYDPEIAGDYSLRFYCFLTGRKLWKITLLEEPVKLFSINCLFFQMDWDYFFYHTGGQEFMVDNRKRFNIREQLLFQTLLVGEEDDIQDELRRSSYLFRDSMIFNCYFSPIIAPPFNLAAQTDEVVSFLRYPTVAVRNSPIKLAVANTKQAALDMTIQVLLQTRQERRCLDQNELLSQKEIIDQEEFLNLIRADTDSSRRLLIELAEQLTSFDNGYEDPSTHLQFQETYSWYNSETFAFNPQLINKIIPEERVPMPMGVPLTSILNRQNSSKSGESNEESPAPYSIIFIDVSDRDRANYQNSNLAHFYRETEELEVSRPQSKATNVFRIRANVDLSMGTRASDAFLKLYKETDDEMFVISPYRFLIECKWNSVWYQSFAQAIFFIAMVIMYTIYMYNTIQLGYVIVLLVMLTIFSILEGIGMVMDFRDYLSDYENYLDVVGICLAYLTTIWKYVEGTGAFQPALLFFMVMALLVLYLRVLAHLKVFESLTHDMIMIFAIIWKIKYLLLVFAIIITFLSLIYARTFWRPNWTFIFQYMYLTIYGNPRDLLPSTYLQYIIVVIVGIFFSLMMVNFFIATMSKNYEDLKEQKEMLIYQYRAKLIHEIETRHRLRLYVISCFNYAKRRLTDAGGDRFIRDKTPNFVYLFSQDLNDLWNSKESVQEDKQLAEQGSITDKLYKDLEEVRKNQENLYEQIISEFKNANHTVTSFLT